MSQAPRYRIIAIDDDPTGSQTVHSCLLLLRWEVADLVAALRDSSPILFILTNSRALSAAAAATVTREVCENLRLALAELAAAGEPVIPLLVSRSDSTLRGHYPLESDIIAAELGPFDAHFIIPAFFEGGRITRDATHYLRQGEAWVAVDQTEFARDSVFGFRSSWLPAWVEEKSGGRITAAEVIHFDRAAVTGDCQGALLALTDNRCCVVDAEQQSDLDHFASQLMAAIDQGKRYLFRSAASLLTALAKLPPQPIAAERMNCYVRHGAAGVVLVGSHVERSSRQLAALLEQPGVVPIEVDVDRVDRDPEALLDACQAAVAAAHAAGHTAVIYTSRGERQFPDQTQRLAFGERVSALLMALVRQLPPTIGYLISKGGITSNDVLSSGLALHSARLLGQIHPGCSVVRCPEDHPTQPRLPVVIFPGNVGDDATLVVIHDRLRQPSRCQPPA